MHNPDRGPAQASVPHDACPTPPTLVIPHEAGMISYLAIAVICFVFTGLSIAALVVFGPKQGVVAAVVGVSLLMMIFGPLLMRRGRRRIRALVEAHRALPPEAMLRASIRPLRGAYALSTIADFAREAAANGVTHVSARIGPAKTPPLGPPITVPFEPRPLDSCGDAGNDGGTNADGGMPGEPVRTTTDRRIRRNMLLKGGWALLIIFSLNVLIAALDSWRSQSVKPTLVLWSIALAATALAPVGARAGAKQAQWLVVPSGVIVRTSGMFSREWRTHLFAPRASLLLSFHVHRHVWALVVADGKDAFAAACTREEADFALRAWRSPLAPPTADRVSDLS